MLLEGTWMEKYQIKINRRHGEESSGKEGVYQNLICGIDMTKS